MAVYGRGIGRDTAHRNEAVTQAEFVKDVRIGHATARAGGQGASGIQKSSFMKRFTMPDEASSQGTVYSAGDGVLRHSKRRFRLGICGASVGTGASEISFGRVALLHFGVDLGGCALPARFLVATIAAVQERLACWKALASRDRSRACYWQLGNDSMHEPQSRSDEWRGSNIHE